ncbi:MAG: gamma-glutamyl-gamma-aminobutyrate hydrolase family protein [Candidatus Omnitrophica bacterium]|nr:gamma-glutamyl-gamma-aminobutyrate hydrolase family protein [Candidatus Omnitrophota bacterium]
MILYVYPDTLEKYHQATQVITIRNRLEELAKDACLILHYSQVNLSLLNRLQPWAICHGGTGTLYEEYDVLKNKEYKKAVKESNFPQIGFCGGHQIIAKFFGSSLGPIRLLKKGEPDLSAYRPGYFKEWGFYPVKIVRKDALFSGCSQTIMVPEYHFWEVKKLGPELVLLASSRNCRVQVFRHRTRFIYGTQFHPESANEVYPDGTKILRNFFHLARQAVFPSEEAKCRTS